MIWYIEEKEKKKRRKREEIKKYQNTILIIMYGPLQFHIFLLDGAWACYRLTIPYHSHYIPSLLRIVVYNGG